MFDLIRFLRFGLPDADQSCATGAKPYGRAFWCAYASNSFTVISIAILFRYADFVACLGGTEFHLGFIVGTGMFGALAMRAIQGICIDRYGPRLVWLSSLAVLMASTMAHLYITRVDGPSIYLLRILMMCGVAGTFGASITFISLRAPPGRLGEMIGMLGTSGFVGMLIGPILGDWMFDATEITRSHVNRMFLVSASMVAVSLVCVSFATHGHARPPARRQPGMINTLRKYNPGTILLIGMAVGVAGGIPSIFLRTYTMHLGISHIKVFFIVYALTAFIVRFINRKFVDRIGVRPAIQIGLSSTAISMLLYLTVKNEWTLAIPALFAGTGHAFLYPAVVTGGSAGFPARDRGTGTTLMLSTFDIGHLVGQPAIGTVLAFSPLLGLSSYPTMFAIMAVGLALIGVFYSVLSSTHLAERRLRQAELPRYVEEKRPEPVTVDV